MSDQPRVVIVGAGLVGCLAACMMDNHGWSVEIFEARSDFRLASEATASRARSINLAFSARGIQAIRAIDPEMVGRLLNQVTPMKGRMIHSLEGKLSSQPYGLHDECINSIDRNLLNQSILSEAERRLNVKVHFNKKLVKAELEKSLLTFQDTSTQEMVQLSADLIMGADGSYSKVREQIMRHSRVDFSQEYIDDLYLELSIPAGVDEKTGEPKFLLDPNHLHIWPRRSFMLIALPNQDRSFTCTLFAPYKGVFDRLGVPTDKEDEARIIAFFQKYFPDALALIGQTELVRCFAENPRGSLLTIKCNPYHFKDKAIIIGDAAHSMVPFYGQGMNCGLEDVRKLNELFQRHGKRASPDGLGMILGTYSASRHQDLVAICDLALQNYKEMRDKVTRVDFLIRKAIDGWLAKAWFLRGSWVPLYTMVTFRDDLNYAEVVRRETRQSTIIDWSLRLFLGSSGVAILAALLKHVPRFRRGLTH